MSEPEHTPTPPPLWIREQDLNIHVDAPNGDSTLGYAEWRSLATFHGSDEDPENGRQVALSNALMFVEAHEVKRQRDVLLEAMETFMEESGDCFIACWQQMEAAINKAKKKEMSDTPETDARAAMDLIGRCRTLEEQRKDMMDALLLIKSITTQPLGPRGWDAIREIAGSTIDKAKKSHE